MQSAFVSIALLLVTDTMGNVVTRGRKNLEESASQGKRRQGEMQRQFLNPKYVKSIFKISPSGLGFISNESYQGSDASRCLTVSCGQTVEVWQSA